MRPCQFAETALSFPPVIFGRQQGLCTELKIYTRINNFCTTVELCPRSRRGYARLSIALKTRFDIHAASNADALPLILPEGAFPFRIIIYYNESRGEAIDHDKYT